MYVCFFNFCFVRIEVNLFEFFFRHLNVENGSDVKCKWIFSSPKCGPYVVFIFDEAILCQRFEMVLRIPICAIYRILSSSSLSLMLSSFGSFVCSFLTFGLFPIYSQFWLVHCSKEGTRNAFSICSFSFFFLFLSCASYTLYSLGFAFREFTYYLDYPKTWAIPEMCTSSWHEMTWQLCFASKSYKAQCIHEKREWIKPNERRTSIKIN